MKKLKNILVPTDFSVTARNAFHYAEKLAQATGTEITVAHVNEFFIPISDIAVAPLSRNEEPQMDEAMENFIHEEDISKGVLTKKDIKIRILKGNPMHRIVDLSKENGTGWIVMGTTGLQDFISKIIGSTSFYVVNQAQCPVFLISRDVKWRPIKRIMFASNVLSSNPEMLKHITDFAEIFNAAVHFVHVDDGANSSVQVTDAIWEELLTREAPTISFQIHSIGKEDTVESLNKYAVEHKIDLVAFISSHRSFWQHLIHKSVTERFALTSTCPMLVMHFDDKKYV